MTDVENAAAPAANGRVREEQTGGDGDVNATRSVHHGTDDNKQEKGSATARAKSAAGKVWGNANHLGKNKKGQHRFGARTLSEIASQAAKILPAPIRRCGDKLFFSAGSGGICWIENSAALMALMAQFVGEIRWARGEDIYAITMPSKSEFYEYLRATVDVYDEIATAPHWPAVPAVYYAHERLIESTGGRALAGLLAFYNPASPADEAILRAMLRTLVWGGPGGKRPLFIIYCDGQQETGKTSVIETAAQLVGGFHKMQPGNQRESLAGQLLSHEGRQYRVALLDNVTSAMRSAEIADLLTAGRIMGESKYMAVGSRPNLVTWVMTTNTPDLSTDLASRSFILRITPADKDARPTWFSEISAYIAERRSEILADLLAELRDNSTAIPINAKRSRFPEWDEHVLNRGPLAHLANDVLVGRLRDIREHDGEREQLTTFVTLMAAIASGEARAPWLPTRQDIERELRPDELAAVWNHATGEKRGAQSVAQHEVRPAIDRGWLPWLSRNPSRKQGSRWRIDLPLLFEAAGSSGSRAAACNRSADTQ